MRRNKKARYLVILIIAIAAIASYAYLRTTNFFEIDACLDCGGRWDYETEKCDTSTADASILSVPLIK